MWLKFSNLKQYFFFLDRVFSCRSFVLSFFFNSPSLIYVCVSSVWRLFLLNVVHRFQHFYNQKQNKKKPMNFLLIKVFVFTLTFLMLLFINFMSPFVCVSFRFVWCVYLFVGLLDSKCLVLMPLAMNEIRYWTVPTTIAHTQIHAYTCHAYTHSHSHHVDNNSQRWTKY